MARNTTDNIDWLIKEYDCQEYIKELLLSSSIQMSHINFSNSMFEYSNITEFSSDMSNVLNADSMFYASDIETFSSDVNNRTLTSHMFQKSKLKYMTGYVYVSPLGLGLSDSFSWTPYYKLKTMNWYQRIIHKIKGN